MIVRKKNDVSFGLGIAQPGPKVYSQQTLVIFCRFAGFTKMQLT